MNDAENTIKKFLPGDVTLEEIQMMAWLQGLLKTQGAPNGPRTV